MGAGTGRETVVTRQREEQEVAKPRRALRWALQAGLQGADIHQQSRSQSGSGNPSGDMSAGHSQEWQSQSALMVSALCFSTKEKSMNQQLAPHQQRVVEEKRELDEKLQKLKAFISSASFTTIVQDEAERGRLVCQEEIMNDYSAVLGERIAAF